MIDFIVGGFVQAGVALLLASLLYVGSVGWRRARGQRSETWSRWTGLHLPPRPADGIFFFVSFFLIGAGFALLTRFLVPDYLEMARQTPQHRIAELSWFGFAMAAPVYAFITTGFSEELLFRGVLAKRLMAWLGTGSGNVVQAMLFGLLHAYLVRIGAPESGAVTYVLLGGFVTAMAWVAGWAMEERGNGSIFLPWLMHGGANLATTLVYLAAPVPS